MKLLILLFLIGVATSAYSQTDFYKINLKSLTNDSIKMNDLRGKMLLIVNTASDSSTSQLQELQVLYSKYKDSGLVVIAIPSDDFGHEKKTGNDLKSRYSAYTFTVADRQNLKGTNQSTLYAWLTKGTNNGIVDNPIKGDYKKFLVNRDGRLVGAFDELSSVKESFFLLSFSINK